MKCRQRVMQWTREQVMQRVITLLPVDHQEDEHELIHEVPLLPDR